MQLEQFLVPIQIEQDSTRNIQKSSKKSFQDFFITNGSHNFEIAEAEREQIRTVQTRRQVQRETLAKRQNERRYLQSRARQLSMDSTFDKEYVPLTQRASSVRQVDKVGWEHVTGMNKKYLKAVYTPNVIQRDAQAVNKIVERQNEETAINTSKTQAYALKRKQIMGRMNNLRMKNKQLENASGIYKLSPSRPQTTNSKVSPRMLQLSRPKKQSSPNNPFTSQDFRGLIHADHPQVISKPQEQGKASTFNEIPITVTKTAQASPGREFQISKEAEQMEQDISDFENRSIVERKRYGFPKTYLNASTKLNRRKPVSLQNARTEDLSLLGGAIFR